MDDSSDVATLFTEIKTLSNKMEDNTSAYDALHEAKEKLFEYQQSNGEFLVDDMHNFKYWCNEIMFILPLKVQKIWF